MSRERLKNSGFSPILLKSIRVSGPSKEAQLRPVWVTGACVVGQASREGLVIMHAARIRLVRLVKNKRLKVLSADLCEKKTLLAN
jgi:hypothetical protein